MILAAKFYIHAARHTQWLSAGKHANEIIGHDPVFPPLLLGFCLLYLGKSISVYSKEKFAQQPRRYATPLVIVALVAGIVVLALPDVIEGTRLEMIGWFFVAVPVVWLLLRLEALGGRVALKVVTAGLLLLIVAGLCNPTLEVLHQLFGGFEYLPPVEPAVRKVLATNSVIMGLAILGAACDLLVALLFTGHLIVPFGEGPFSVLEQRSNEPWYREIARSSLRAVALLFILLGQGYFLRFALWAIFHGFVLDVLPLYVWWYAGIALVIHYVAYQRLGSTSAIK